MRIKSIKAFRLLTKNTVPFLVFAVKNTPAKFSSSIHPVCRPSQAASGSRVRPEECSSASVNNFGNYEFLCSSYGLSGASGVRPILFCLSPKMSLMQGRFPYFIHEFEPCRTIRTASWRHGVFSYCPPNEPWHPSSFLISQN